MSDLLAAIQAAGGMADVRANPTRAERSFARFHWGRSGRARRIEIPDPPAELWELGELRAVAYATRKGSDAPAIWWHEFSRKHPALAADPSGRLYIIGGSYRITSRGIEG